MHPVRQNQIQAVEEMGVARTDALCGNRRASGQDVSAGSALSRQMPARGNAKCGNRRALTREPGAARILSTDKSGNRIVSELSGMIQTKVIRGGTHKGGNRRVLPRIIAERQRGNRGARMRSRLKWHCAKHRRLNSMLK